ncbi:MAG: S-adenosylmethionine:tRNA ribosyltransferase-isomerase, partial [Lachnospiraceae bacterium]|nr:S-adenosylmethionine:tRNA ribosyltransferase-isomerase [Lachnospiraceae bacterium]
MIGYATADYAYDLPKELIAQDPLADRSSSRLLVLDRQSGAVSHHIFREVGSFLHPGDCLVFNDTRVIPARLLGVKKDTGAAVEILLLKRLTKEEERAAADEVNTCDWECLVRPGKKLRPGAEVVFGVPADAPSAQSSDDDERKPLTGESCASSAPLTARILETKDDGNRIVRFFFRGIWEEVLDALGEMPLPPYITHKLPRENRNRYQTVYARH